MIRYYKNNFNDGFRQDGIDLFLGLYLAKENEGKLIDCPLKGKKGWKYLTLPILLIASTSMFFLNLFLSTEFTTETFVWFLFWSGMISLIVFLILYNGPEFVDYPKLRKIERKKQQ